MPSVPTTTPIVTKLGLIRSRGTATAHCARRLRPPGRAPVQPLVELIYNERQGPWRTVEDVELATLGWVDGWNTSRLLEPISNVPPAEFEASWRDAAQNRRIGALLSASNDGGGINTPGEPEPATRLAGLVTEMTGSPSDAARFNLRKSVLQARC
jgi:hypothetical protein